MLLTYFFLQLFFPVHSAEEVTKHSIEVVILPGVEARVAAGTKVLHEL